MATMGGGFFHCVDLRETLQNSSLPKPLFRFWSNFTGLFLGWPFSKVGREILIHQETWPPWGGDFLHYTDMKKFFKYLLLWNPWFDFEIISQECSLGYPFQKLFANFDSSKNIAAMRGRLFPLYGHEEIHKKSSSSTLLVRIWNNFTRFSLCDPFKKLFATIWSVEKYGRHGGRLFHCVDFREILQNSSSLKLFVRIWNDITGLFLGWHFF